MAPVGGLIAAGPLPGCMRVGLVVNPIAGMGGRVGLKGTDGKLEEARARGAEPRAPARAVDALQALQQRRPDTTIITWGGAMGADPARRVGLETCVIGVPASDETTAGDTREAVQELAAAGIDVLLFVGGDGTAVDVTLALEDVEEAVPIIGVPAGVKVYSAVFAVSPEAAGRIAVSFDRVEDREVNDIDEAAYREGEVEARLRGVVPVPVAEGLQGSKQTHAGTVEALAAGVAAEVDPDVTYVFGPGGTVGTITTELGFEGSPLGVDVWRDGELLVRDGSESEILDALGDHNMIVVSPVGGQGFILGRGNDQISPTVLGRAELTVVASRAKLDEVGALRVDTGDPEVDEQLRGWIRVRVGRFEHRLVKVV
jgi:predicted polyphosphate/ATP-dependent NAD kinase